MSSDRHASNYKYTTQNLHCHTTTTVYITGITCRYMRCVYSNQTPQDTFGLLGSWAAMHLSVKRSNTNNTFNTGNGRNLALKTSSVLCIQCNFKMLLQICTHRHVSCGPTSSCAGWIKAAWLFSLFAVIITAELNSHVPASPAIVIGRSIITVQGKTNLPQYHN